MSPLRLGVFLESLFFFFFFPRVCLTSANTLWSLLYLQGMSEEAVRQTRSQKRALERDALPQSTEPSTSDSDSKKPKLDPSEAAAETQTEAETLPGAPGADLSRTRNTPKEERRDGDGDVEEEEEERGQGPLPSGSPLAPGPVTNDEEATQRQETGEPSSDNRTDCEDGAGQVKTEPTADTRDRPPATEPKAAGGEVKATIKVEVQTGEQPVDMSTSKR